MNRIELIAACEKCNGPAAMKRVVDAALRHLRQKADLQVEASTSPQTVEHFRSIYRRRVQHAKTCGFVPAGLNESSSVFEALPDGSLLTSAAVDDGDASLFFWMNTSGDVIACVVSQTPPTPDSPPSTPRG